MFFHQSLNPPTLMVLYAFALCVLPWAMKKNSRLDIGVRKVEKHGLWLMVVVLAVLYGTRGGTFHHALAIFLVALPTLAVWIAGPSRANNGSTATLKAPSTLG